MRHDLNIFEKSIGGQSRSPAKLAAARKNAKLGGQAADAGRPTKYKTLGEYIMQKPLSRDQVAALDDAWLTLKYSHRIRLLKFYVLGWNEKRAGYTYSMDFRRTDFDRKNPKRIRELLRKLRWNARWEMKQQRKN